MILGTLISAIAISVTALAWGYWEYGSFTFALSILLVGSLWAVSIWRRWKWFAPLGVAILVFFAVFGLWRHLNPIWVFISILWTVLAWDLGSFGERLALVTLADQETMSRLHLKRLLSFSLLAFLFIFFAFIAQFHISLEWIILLTVVLLAGLMQLMTRIGQ